MHSGSAAAGSSVPGPSPVATTWVGLLRTWDVATVAAEMNLFIVITLTLNTHMQLVATLSGSRTSLSNFCPMSGFPVGIEPAGHGDWLRASPPYITDSFHLLSTYCMPGTTPTAWPNPPTAQGGGYSLPQIHFPHEYTDQGALGDFFKLPQLKSDGARIWTWS